MSKLLSCEGLNAEERSFVSQFNETVKFDEKFKFDEAVSKFLQSKFELKLHNNKTTNLGKSVDIKDLINNGNLLLLKGENDEAVKYYDAALDREPTNKYALNNKGIVLYNEGKIEEAVLYYSEAISIDPVFYDALYNMGLVRLDTSSYRSAQDCFKRALEIKPDSVDALNNLGIAEMEIGIKQKQKMEEVLKRWEEESNRIEKPHKKLMELINQIEFYQKLRNAINQIPIQFINRDDINIDSGEKILADAMIATLGKSIQRYDVVLKLDPDNINLTGNNAKIAEELSILNDSSIKKIEKSIQRYDLALKLDPDNINIIVNKAKALYELEHYEECNKVSDRALSLDSTNPAANYFKGKALKSLGKTNEADLFLNKSDQKKYDGKSLKSRNVSISYMSPI